jgi:hypothetical protein
VPSRTPTVDATKSSMMQRLRSVLLELLVHKVLASPRYLLVRQLRDSPRHLCSGTCQLCSGPRGLRSSGFHAGLAPACQRPTCRTAPPCSPTTAPRKPRCSPRQRRNRRRVTSHANSSSRVHLLIPATCGADVLSMIERARPSSFAPQVWPRSAAVEPTRRAASSVNREVGHRGPRWPHAFDRRIKNNTASTTIQRRFNAISTWFPPAARLNSRCANAAPSRQRSG